MFNKDEDYSRLFAQHIDHLLHYEEIESSCAISSQLLGSYFEQEGWKVVYGAYGPEQFFHSWLETPEGILDPTRFQFLTNRKEINYYKNSECTPYDAYILQVQDTWFFPLTDPSYRSMAVIEPLWAPSESSYLAFLEQIRNEETYLRFRWTESRLKGSQQSFQLWLNEHHQRIGKKHFYRFAICPDNRRRKKTARGS